VSGKWDLVVSEDDRSLVKSDGTPWFWLGDTAWDLFTRLTREEVDTYFRNRADKGFTVIQAVLAMGMHGEFNAPNAYDHRPFLARSTEPDLRAAESFWTHVDHILQTAAQNGLYLGLLPLWGYDYVAGRGYGGGKLRTEIAFDQESATAYAEFLASRYSSTPNIIWINGGDVAGDENGDADVALWRSIGETLKRVDPDHLVTFHPAGRHSSSSHFHGDAWLDFNMIQSGQKKKDFPSDEMIDTDYALSPAKPVLDGEPRYEGHPLEWKPANGFRQAFDVRQAAYWSLFAGSFGHTYGHANLWRFTVSGRRLVTQHSDMLDLDWQEAMDFPGAYQMTYVRRLMLSRPLVGRRPAQSLLAGNYPGGARVRATLGDGYAFFYSPCGEPIGVTARRLGWRASSCWWYDPRTGTAHQAVPASDGDIRAFSPPGRPYRGNDWVLVIDDASRDFRPPGAGRAEAG